VILLDDDDASARASLLAPSSSISTYCIFIKDQIFTCFGHYVLASLCLDIFRFRSNESTPDFLKKLTMATEKAYAVDSNRLCLHVPPAIESPRINPSSSSKGRANTARFLVER
jgi:hypothetical protein